MTLVLFAAIVVLRQRLVRGLAREQEVARVWNPLLAECAERVPPALPALSRGDVELFLILWCKAQESLRGEAQKRLRELAGRLDIAPVALRMLSSRTPRRKLLALVTLGHLRERSAVPSLLILLVEAPALVSMTAAQAFIRIDPAIAMTHVLAMTARRRDWALAKVAAMLMDCNPQEVGLSLAAALRAEMHTRRDERLPGAGLARLLRLHVAAESGTVRDAALEALGQAKSVDTLVAALAALSHPQDARHARGLLRHGEWAVRAAAARALHRLGGPHDFAWLCAALGDRSWWVRYRAAQALCTLAEPDPEELRALPGEPIDAFAAEILRHALAERGRA